MTYPGQGAAQANVMLNANVAGYNQAMAQATEHTGRLSAALGTVAKHLTGIQGKVAHGMVKVAKDEFAYLGAATTLAATFEKQLGTLNARSKVTGESFKGMKSSVESSFAKFPVARKDIIALTESLTNLGVKGTANLKSLTQTFIKLGAATGESPDALATGLIQLTRLTGGASAQQVGNYANSLLTVSANAGVSATSVLNFSQAIAPLARQAGIGTAAVLGISTAFSKAGADGFVAANAFNSMISQIASLSATGSPELAKYANLIGVTVDQFKSMDKTTALTEIFETINKQGPGAIDTLNRLGFDGVRTLNSIQAVASSGDLRGQVAIALGASTNQDNLDKGSKAGFKGLADEGIQIKNTVTQTGTSIGTTFLTPLTKVLGVVNMIMKGFNELAPVKAVVGALAGAFLLLGAAMLVVAAASSKLLLGAFVARSGPVAALRAGLRTPVGPSSAQNARPWNAPFYTGGQRIRMGWERGRGVLTDQRMAREANYLTRDQATVAAGGRLALDRTPEQAAQVRAAQFAAGGNLRQRIRGAILGPRGLGAGSLIETQRQFVQTAGRPADSRAPGMMPRVAYQGQRLSSFLRGTEPPTPPPPSMEPRGPRNLLARAVSTTSPEMRAYNASLKTTTTTTERLAAAEARLSQAMTSGTVAEKQAAASARATALAAKEAAIADQQTRLKEAEAANAAAFANRSLASQSLKLTGQFIRLQGASAVAATRTAAAGVTGLAGGIANVAKGIGLMTGLFVGIPLALGAINAFKHNQQKAEDEHGKNLNPITKYDDQLGIATTHLASFSVAAASATDKLNGITAGSNLNDAANVSDSDRANAQGGKSDDKSINAAYKSSDNDQQQQAALAAILPGYNMTDPREVAMFKYNALAKGFSKPAIEGALNKTSSTAGGDRGTNFTEIAGRIAGTEGQGRATTTATSGSNLGDVALTQIGLDYTANQDQSGTSYAAQKRLADEASLFASQIRAGGDSGAKASLNRKQIGAEMAQEYGGKASTYEDRIHQDQSGDRAGMFKKMSDTELQQYVIDHIIGSTDEGQRSLGNVKALKGSTLDVTKMTPALQAFLTKGPDTTADVKLLRDSGKLGQVASRDSSIREAKAHPDDPKLQLAATKSLLADAQSLGGGFDGVSKRLDQFLIDIKDTSSQFYILGQGAKTLNDALLQTAMASLNRAPQFEAIASDYATTATSAARGDVDAIKDLPSKKQAYDQAVIADQQFRVQVYQQMLAYQVQTQRAQDAFDLQRAHAVRDFNTQQLYAQADNQLQVLRSTTDFHRNMAREAQSAAESIYDPFARVQAEYTTDAGTLVENLVDQNERIARQQAQLVALHKRGLTQQAIDTLQLANPDKAQQVDELSTGTTAQQISQINAEAAKRLKSTTTLTQSSLSETWRHTLEDFNRQTAQSAHDFERATNRAIAAQDLSMHDMVEAFGIQQNNAAEDMAVSMKSLLGNFGSQVAEARSHMSGMLKLLPKDLQADFTAAFHDISTKAGEVADTLSRLDVDHGPHHNTYNYGTPNGAPAPGAYNMPNLDGTPNPDGDPATLKGHARGGISTYAHVANMSEGDKAETIIPLDERGLRFMTGFVSQVSMAMVRQMQTSRHPAMPSGGGSTSITYHVDQGNTFSGAVTVQASDPNAMARALAAKARLNALSSPIRHKT